MSPAATEMEAVVTVAPVPYAHELAVTTFNATGSLPQSFLEEGHHGAGLGSGAGELDEHLRALPTRDDQVDR